MKRSKKFKNGLKAAFSNRRRTVASSVFTLTVFIAMNLAARPIFSQQMISSNILLLPEAVYLVFVYNSANLFQMISTAIYALLCRTCIGFNVYSIPNLRFRNRRYSKHCSRHGCKRMCRMRSRNNRATRFNRRSRSFTVQRTSNNSCSHINDNILYNKIRKPRNM